MGINLPPMHHVAITVENLETAAKFYEAFGVKWHPARETHLDEAYWKGEPCPFTSRVLYGDMDGVLLELVETTEGETVDLEFLRNRGQGVSHIGYNVTDMKATVDELAKYGIKPIHEGKSPGGTEFIFVDMGGVYAEFVYRPQKDLRAALAGKSEGH